MDPCECTHAHNNTSCEQESCVKIIDQALSIKQTDRCLVQELFSLLEPKLSIQTPHFAKNTQIAAQDALKKILTSTCKFISLSSFAGWAILLKNLHNSLQNNK